jgi:Leucine-rich repeat (LRR) protein
MRNAIPALDKTFFQPALAASLTSLDLSGNKRIRLHGDAFSAMANLKELKLMDCELDSLDEALFDRLASLESLNLHSNKLNQLPAGLFKNLTSLRSLVLRNNPFEGLPQGVLDPLVSLEELELGYNYFRSLPPNLIGGNIKLKRFEFHVNGGFCPPQRPGCEVPAIRLNLTGSLFANPSLEVIKMLHVALVGTVPENLFRGCTGLRNVTIQSAHIERLPEGLFTDMPNLELIDLAGNKLTSLSAGTFSGLPKLKSLRLLANQISQIDSNTFSGLTSLEVLQLHQNRIKEISGDLFRDLSRLETLHLHQNLIETIHPAALATNGQLRSLDLAYNNITMDQSRQRNSRFLSGQAFESLAVLNLTFNNISYLEESLLANFLNLRVLNLSHNAFFEINILDMAFVKNSLLTLDLSFNQITTFSMEATPEAAFVFNTSSAYVLLLEENPLRCDCFLSDLRQKVTDELVSVVGDKIQLVNADRLRCGPTSPASLVGRPLATVRYKELNCVFPSPVLRDSCPNACACAYNRYYDEAGLHINLKNVP